MKTLPISADLSLPLDAVTQKLAFLGRTGTGKTYAAMKTCELMMDAGAQVLVFDPVSVWFGLRLDGSGEKPSRFTLPVFGGDHGDLPLTATAGRPIARLVVERSLSAVLDVSQLRKGDRKQFATDFAEEFFHLKKSNRSPVHLFIEEAQTFVPQKTFKGEERMLGAFEDVIKLGRNYGVGASIISQRPQAVNKDALNQTECLFAFQMTGPQERKAMADWVSEKGLDQRIANDLPKLKRGTAHVWSPQWLQISRVVTIARKTTSDVSATPSFSHSFQAGQLSPINVETLKSELAEVITQAEADNPAALRRRIAQLESENKRLAAQPPSKEVERIEVPVINPEEIEGLKSLLESFMRIASEVSTEVGRVGLKFQQRAPELAARPESAAVNRRVPANPAAQRSTAEADKSQRFFSRSASAVASNTGQKLREGERKMLLVLGQFSHLGTLTRDQLALLSGYTRSGTFDTYIGTVIREGLAEKVGGGELRINAAGRAYLGDSALPAPRSSRELIELFGSKLRAGERVMLDLLVAEYPKTISRDDLAQRSGYTRSGTFDTYVGTPTRQLLVVKERAGLKANDFLFMGDAR